MATAGREFYVIMQKRQDKIDFSKQLRRDTLFEVISILQNVPNPKANRTAINRIKMELD